MDHCHRYELSEGWIYDTPEVELKQEVASLCPVTISSIQQLKRNNSREEEEGSECKDGG